MWLLASDYHIRNEFLRHLSDQIQPFKRVFYPKRAAMRLGQAQQDKGVSTDALSDSDVFELMSMLTLKPVFRKMMAR